MEEREKRGRGGTGKVVVLAIVFVGLLVPVGIALTLLYLALPVKVEGTAMLPALADGDRILVSRRFGGLKRGDIVVFHYPPEPSKSYIKRIVGLPGEVVEVRGGRVLIDGSPLAEPYLDPERNQALLDLAPVSLPEESYFALGDNRDNSSDSRSWGPLGREFIYGKYAARYWRARGD
ncbi:MAG: signal peptidase I [Acidobacteria bacterium]|nr:signal peptidase I [Acidobacteriota bacterium]